MPGQLYVVSTPIGNLEDITLRALRILKEVDIIAAEDTRHTRQLLSHFDIHCSHLESCHSFNEHDKVDKLLDEVEKDEPGDRYEGSDPIQMEEVDQEIIDILEECISNFQPK